MQLVKLCVVCERGRCLCMRRRSFTLQAPNSCILMDIAFVMIKTWSNEGVPPDSEMSPYILFHIVICLIKFHCWIALCFNNTANVYIDCFSEQSTSSFNKLIKVFWMANENVNWFQCIAYCFTVFKNISKRWYLDSSTLVVL